MMKKNISVSVIVPVFNVGEYLRECLDSILNQTINNIEIICGDGGSTDGSLEILKEYEKKDNRITVISKKGSGYGQSVNECIDIAKGEYIGIVESDDKINKTMYEKLYKVASKYELDWVKSDIYFYYSKMEKEHQLGRESITYGKRIYNKVLNPQTDVRPYKSALHTWAGIYKKEFLTKYSINHNETQGGAYQDVGFYLKTLYYAKKVYFIKEPLYYWRQDNPGSSIHYNEKKLIENSFHEWKLNEDYLYANNVKNLMMWGSFNYRRYYSYLWTIDMSGKYKNEVIKKAKEDLRDAYDKGLVVKKFFSYTEWRKFKKFIN